MAAWPKRKEFAGLHFLKTFIPENIAIGRAPSRSKPLTLVDPYVPGAVAFRNLSEEVSNLLL
jgi:cellulose biosynthesis protein BcsQ